MKRHWIPRLAGFALVGLLVGAIGLATNEAYYGYDPVRSLSADKRQMFAYTDRWRHHVRLAVGNKRRPVHRLTRHPVSRANRAS